MQILKGILYQVTSTLRIYRRVSGVFLVIFFILPAVNAKNELAPEYQIKAAFLYNFIRFVDWPPEAFSASDTPFVIGILGNDPFGPYIEELVRGEKIGSHPITVRRYANVHSVNCHILFISREAAARLRYSIADFNKRNILTVGDSDDFLQWGGIIRFFKEENKIKIEINTASAKAAQLKVSSKLLSLARIF